MYVELPDESIKCFDELCTLSSSKRVFAEDYCDFGIPFYRGKEITLKRNGEPISDPLYISQAHYEVLKSNYGVPQCGDILITAVGTIGNSYMVQNEDFYFKDGNIIWLNNFAHKQINYYLYDYMQTSLFKQDLEGICIGSTQTALTIVALSKLKVKIPNDTFLAQYYSTSYAIRKQIEANNKEVLHLTELSKVLLSSLSH